MQIWLLTHLSSQSRIFLPPFSNKRRTNTLLPTQPQQPQRVSRLIILSLSPDRYQNRGLLSLLSVEMSKGRRSKDKSAHVRLKTIIILWSSTHLRRIVLQCRTFSPSKSHPAISEESYQVFSPAQGIFTAKINASGKELFLSSCGLLTRLHCCCTISQMNNASNRAI